MIELLIEHGANVNAEDEDGDTPLHLAVIHQAVGSPGLRGVGTVKMLINRLTDWLTGWLADWLTGWLADWLTGWLADWLTGWLMSGWTEEQTLMNRRTDRQTDWLIFCQTDAWNDGRTGGQTATTDRQIDGLMFWLTNWPSDCPCGCLLGWLVFSLRLFAYPRLLWFCFCFFLLLLFWRVALLFFFVMLLCGFKHCLTVSTQLNISLWMYRAIKIHSAYFIINYFQIISATSRLRTQCPSRRHRSEHGVSHCCLFSPSWSEHQLFQSRGKDSIGPMCRPPDCQLNQTICEECSQVGRGFI